MPDTSVAIAESHGITLWSIASIVEDHGGKVVGTPQTGFRTLEVVENKKPRVLILSPDMPRLHGVEVLRHLENRTLAMEIMVLTAHEGVDAARDAFRRGVTSYLLKADPLDALGPAFRATAEGERVLSPALPEDLLETPPDSPKPRRYRHLTERQKEVLELTAEGYTGKEMGDRLGLSRRTIEKHRREIRDTLGLDSVVELTRYAVEMGFYRTPSSDWLSEKANMDEADDSGDAD